MPDDVQKRGPGVTIDPLRCRVATPGLELAGLNDDRKRWRSVAGVISSVLLAAGMVAGWIWAKIHILDGWDFFSLAFISFFIAVAVGWVLRRTCTGGFGFAAFAVLLTAVSGVTGSVLEYRIDFERRLKQVVTAAWDETFEYAQRTVADPWISGTKWSDASPQCFLIGQLASGESKGRDYWNTRNLLFTHWIASRQLKVYGQTGPDRTIWEATRLIKEPFFLDAWLLQHAEDPVTDAAVATFQRDELPFLKRVAEEKISAAEFRTELTRRVKERISWSFMLWESCGVMLLFSLIFGGIAAHILAGNFSELADAIPENPG